MRGVGVAQGVRVRRHGRSPIEDAADVAGRKPPASPVQEHSSLRAVGVPWKWPTRSARSSARGAPCRLFRQRSPTPPSGRSPNRRGHSTRRHGAPSRKGAPTRRRLANAPPRRGAFHLTLAGGSPREERSAHQPQGPEAGGPRRSERSGVSPGPWRRIRVVRRRRSTA
jgi:hypothetical protein